MARGYAGGSGGDGGVYAGGMGGVGPGCDLNGGGIVSAAEHRGPVRETVGKPSNGVGAAVLAGDASRRTVHRRPHTASDRPADERPGNRSGARRDGRQYYYPDAGPGGYADESGGGTQPQ